MPVGRFAPTPSGYLHLGNLCCFLLAWLSAKSKGGEIILRVEDLDRERTYPAFEEQAEEDLRFLGLDWERGGLSDSREFRQSERSGIYEELLASLTARGLTYPCFCSRAELHAANAPHSADGDPIYNGKCRGLSAEDIENLSKKRSPAVRLMVKGKVSFTDGHYGFYEQDLERDCGDFILRRSDGVFAYQLAVVADDALMGVTEVVRGRDLISSTPRQIYLYNLLGFSPPLFFHTPLLLDSQGRRLSKRDRDMGLCALRERGFKAEQIIGGLAFLMGLIDRPEPVGAGELVPEFSWDKVPKEDVRLPGNFFGS